MNHDYPYLYRRAADWVSAVVLVGCICITIVLVYAAYQADVFGKKITALGSEVLESF